MTGFNSEVKRKGVTFHVQTQDVGLPTKCIESLVYKSGKLLSSRKTFYTPLLGSADLREKVQQMMEDQHKAILKEIDEGKFDHYLTPEEKKQSFEKD
ncbi:MAG: hypothetical protein ACUVV5_03100 [Candidatus Aminicenantales bacterium]